MNRLSCPLSFFLAAILLMAALPASADAPTVQADLKATSLRASGSTHLAGQLVAFLQEQSDANAGGGASPHFTLKADRLRLETDSADPVVQTPLFFQRVNPTTSPPEHYANAVVEGVENGAYYRWNAFSADSARPAHAQVSSACIQAASPQTDSIERRSRVNLQRPATIRDAADALEWSCIEGATVTVTGDFWLSLWQWNVTLAANGKTQTLHSGDSPSSHAPPGAPDTSGTVSQYREIYLFAFNGTLTVPLLSGQGYRLLTGPETVLMASSLQIGGASGHLAVQEKRVELEGNALVVKGISTVTVSGRGVGLPFQARLLASPESVVVDGRPLAITTTPSLPSPGLGVLVWGALSCVLVVLVLWGYPLLGYWRLQRRDDSLGGQVPQSWRQRRGVGYWALGSKALARNHARLGSYWAGQASRLFPESLDVQALRALAYQRQGEPALAEQRYSQLYPKVPFGRERAVLALLLVDVNLMMGRAGQASRWLVEVGWQDSKLFEQAARNPRYALLFAKNGGAKAGGRAALPQ